MPFHPLLLFRAGRLKLHVASPEGLTVMSLMRSRPPPGAPIKLPSGCGVSAPLISTHQARFWALAGTVKSQRPLSAAAPDLAVSAADARAAACIATTNVRRVIRLFAQ